jgi:hypothetical protein
LNSPFERDQNIVDGYSFSDLILEMECNAKELTLKTLEAQFNESLKMKLQSAKDIFDSNKENILKYLLNQKV